MIPEGYNSSTAIDIEGAIKDFEPISLGEILRQHVSTLSTTTLKYFWTMKGVYTLASKLVTTLPLKI